MTLHRYKELGCRDEDILPSNPRSVAANDTEIESMGQTMPLKFWIDETIYEWAFLLVKNLGRDTLLLGRDFLKHCDISINIGRGTMQAAKVFHKTPMEMSYAIRKQKTKYNAKSSKEVQIPPGQIYNVEMHITKARSNEEDESTTHSPWLAYANGK